MQDKRIQGRRIGLAVRALRHRNFRVYFFGMFVSCIGTSIQVIAQSWLVYRLTASPFLLGVAGFASQVPIFVLAPLGGVAADRYNRHRIVLLTQTVSMLPSNGLP